MDLTNEFTVPVPVERAWEVLNDVELIAPCLPGAQLQEIEGDEYRGVVKVKVGPITAQYKGAATFLEQDVENRKIVIKAGGRDTRGQGSADAVITATLTESKTADGVETHVKVDSDVTIKGKVAQFGRGMIADVSAKLLTQFVECLEGKLDGSEGAASNDSADDVADDATRTNPGTGETVDSPGDPATEAAKAGADQAKAARPNPDTGEVVESPGDPATEAAKAQATGDTSKVRKIESPEASPVDLLDTAGAPMAKRLAPLGALLFILILLGRRRAKRRR